MGLADHFIAFGVSSSFLLHFALLCLSYYESISGGLELYIVAQPVLESTILLPQPLE